MTEALPLVTIITPAYNRAGYLGETIDSILVQNYPHTEYIVLDDGSTDDTRQVLSRYGNRIRWETHTNMGETRTVNKGIGMAKGDIICIVNSDDPLRPDAISTAAAFLGEHPEVLVAYPDWDMIDSNGHIVRHMRVPEYSYLHMLRRHYCMIGPGAFIRRVAFERAGVRDARFVYVADFEFWLRLGLHGEFARIPRTLATFRVHPASASESQHGAAMSEEHIALMRKLYAMPELPHAVRRVRREAFSSAHYDAFMVCGPQPCRQIKHFLLLCWYWPPNVFRRFEITGGRSPLQNLAAAVRNRF